MSKKHTTAPPVEVHHSIYLNPDGRHSYLDPEKLAKIDRGFWDHGVEELFKLVDAFFLIHPPATCTLTLSSLLQHAIATCKADPEHREILIRESETVLALINLLQKLHLASVPLTYLQDCAFDDKTLRVHKIA